MLISLPMYDWPEVQWATDNVAESIVKYSGQQARFVRETDHKATWRRQDLLFTQTCGYPFTHEFKGLFQYISTPHYAADGCDGPLYSSILFAREKRPLAAFAGSIAALNDGDSMSGMLALKLVFYPYAEQGAFFKRSLVTGGHLASMAAVRAGKADVCAIDAVCVALARKHRPADLGGLVEVARSPSVPGLPFVSRRGDVSAMRRALQMAFDDPATAVAREALLLSGFSVLPSGAYQVIPDLETENQLRGGLEF
jgi:ABC-type phosphate/phosphonate transport system substrate-binding protein